eukprot:scaffold1790_cov73-Phaeocystis_antarctica.AAC.4
MALVPRRREPDELGTVVFVGRVEVGRLAVAQTLPPRERSISAWEGAPAGVTLNLYTPVPRSGAKSWHST